MTTNERVREIRELNKMNQTDFGKKINISRSQVAAIENNLRALTDRTINDICREFNVNENWLRTGEGEMFNNNPISLDEYAKKNDLTEIEIELIKIAMSIPKEHRKRIILQMKEVLAQLDTKEDLTAAIANTGPSEHTPLSFEKIKKLKSEKQEKEQTSRKTDKSSVKELIEESKQTDINVYVESAAAGLGNYLYNDEYFEVISFNDDDIPEGAEFGIRIQGDSMTPKIHDGDIVWVKPSMEVLNHQIGIFILNGKSYCKKLFINHDTRRAYLTSLNDSYDDIIIKQDDEFRAVGKVIGIYHTEQKNRLE